jgi:hypothetical protein
LFALMTRVLLPALMLALSACGAGLPEIPPDQPVSYAAHLEPLILKRCLGCHTAERPEAELVLEQGRGYEQMVGRSSVQAPELMIVAQGDVASSYLWMKLDHRPVKGKGMPRTLTGTERLPAPELQLIHRWIEDGALP